MGADGRRWKVGELASAAGLTVRALHHFDEIGLVRPSYRTSGGHRVYDEHDVRRLYVVLALRELGLALAEINESLAAGLGPVVRAHLTRLEHSLGRQRRLRFQLAELVRILDAADEPTPEQLLAVMEAMLKTRYFTPEQLTRLKARHAEVGGDAFARWRAAWTALSMEARSHIEAGRSPADPQVQDTARRWSDLMTEMTGGDRAILAAMYAKLDGQGAEVATLDAVTTDAWEYMKRALAVGFGAP